MEERKIGKRKSDSSESIFFSHIFFSKMFPVFPIFLLLIFLSKVRSYLSSLASSQG